jgi:NAD(P)-dependent dehydrogenase (short-subunit alcohol dehydrogenase family)
MRTLKLGMLYPYIGTILIIRAETHAINTTSYHFLTFAFLPLLAAAKTVGNYEEPGNIVNIASLSGLCKTSQRGQFNYNSGKWVVSP